MQFLVARKIRGGGNTHVLGVREAAVGDFVEEPPEGEDVDRAVVGLVPEDLRGLYCGSDEIEVLETVVNSLKKKQMMRKWVNFDRS